MLSKCLLAGNGRGESVTMEVGARRRLREAPRRAARVGKRASGFRIPLSLSLRLPAGLLRVPAGALNGALCKTSPFQAKLHLEFQA